MVAEQWAERLRRAADRLPDGEPIFRAARERALRAAAIVTGGLQVDPTLVDYERGGRDLAVLAELVRQLYPLARQAEMAIEHGRLVQDAAPLAERARLGKINPLAPEEFDALSAHLVDVAQRIADGAQPDWNTPARIRERSERRLPKPGLITELADQVLAAVRPALELDYPAPAAVRIAGLAEQLRSEAGQHVHRCTAPGCEHPLQAAATGRPRLYCGATCRQRARRAARALQGR